MKRGVIVYDGFHGHTRQFRFDLDRLANYIPEASKPDRTSAKPRPQPCIPVQGYHPDSVAPTLHPGATNPAPLCHQPCTPVPVTLHAGASTEYQEHQEHQELTGAGAPALTHPETKPDDQDGEPSSLVELADAALGCACRERNDSHENVVAHLQRLAAKRQEPCDQAMAHQAVDAAIARAASRARRLSRKRGPCCPGRRRHARRGAAP